LKLFAITPDHFTCSDILKHLSLLKHNKVDFLYVKSPLSAKSIEDMVPEVSGSGITPIIPYRSNTSIEESLSGLHFKSTEMDLISKINFKKIRLITASCHDYLGSVNLLRYWADYVFVSPVYTPLSKQGDTRKLFPRSGLQKLTAEFGERVILLGGLTWQRIHALQKELSHDFSAAGITMFFNGGHMKHKKNKPTASGKCDGH